MREGLMLTVGFRREPVPAEPLVRRSSAQRERERYWTPYGPPTKN